MKKILLVGSQHGDERLGDRLMRRIKLYHPELLAYVDFCIANPRAHRLNKRYAESDMNRSYSSALNTYEAIRAKKLLTKINEVGYELVLDLHTTTDRMDACFIASGVEQEAVRAFMQASHITKIVVMKHEIVESSFIGNANNAVSIETPLHVIGKEFLEQLIEAIKAYVSPEAPATAEKEIFYVDLLIDKTKYTPAQFRRMKNFELFENSFYPILISSKSYKKFKSYRGFGATTKCTELI